MFKWSTREFWLDVAFMAQALAIFFVFVLVIVAFFVAVVTTMWSLRVDKAFYAFIAFLAIQNLVRSLRDLFIWIQKKAVVAYEEAEDLWL